MYCNMFLFWRLTLNFFSSEKWLSIICEKRKDPDIFCIQETKCQEKDVLKVFIYSLFSICYLTHVVCYTVYISSFLGWGDGGGYSITRLFFNKCLREPNFFNLWNPGAQHMFFFMNKYFLVSQEQMFDCTRDRWVLLEHGPGCTSLL